MRLTRADIAWITAGVLVGLVIGVALECWRR